MLKLILSCLLMTLANQVGAQTLAYDFRESTSTTRFGSIVRETGIMSMIFGFQENGSETLTNSISGNAGTATSLQVNGANCTVSGEFPKGVDASGNAESCTAAGGGGASLTSTQTFTGDNTFAGTVNFSVNKATFTSVKAGNTGGATIFSTCYATVTFVSDGVNPAMISLTGTATAGAVNQESCWSYLVDGQYPPGFTNDTAVICVFGGGTPDENMTGWHPQVLSTGSRNICLTIQGTGGAVSYWPGTYNDVTNRNMQFGVWSPR